MGHWPPYVGRVVSKWGYVDVMRVESSTPDVRVTGLLQMRICTMDRSGEVR